MSLLDEGIEIFVPSVPRSAKAEPLGAGRALPNASTPLVSYTVLANAAFAFAVPVPFGSFRLG